jgi:tRNA pseudouridine38-40 synthase
MQPTGREVGPRPVREDGPVRYRARVEYDGTDFGGFQAQPGRRTVQGELETALTRLGDGSWVRVVAAGRTDAGVHASGQVIAFAYPGRLPTRELARALAAILPDDIGVHGLRRAAPGFHPRYVARYREYRYTVWNGPRSPLRERFALGVRAPLDVAAMAEAASTLVGRHDFSAFGAAERQPIRTVHWIRIRKSGHQVTIDVAADAFLRQMVRSVVAALLRVGRGEIAGSEVAEALRSGNRAFHGAVAPPQGLCLRRVVYDGPARRTEKHDEDVYAQRGGD